MLVIGSERHKKTSRERNKKKRIHHKVAGKRTLDILRQHHLDIKMALAEQIQK